VKKTQITPKIARCLYAAGILCGIYSAVAYYTHGEPPGIITFLAVLAGLLIGIGGFLNWGEDEGEKLD